MADESRRPQRATWFRKARLWWVSGLILALVGVGVGLTIAQTQRYCQSNTIIRRRFHPAQLQSSALRSRV